MDKYITSLIQKKNRVIIPEFGAFIVKQGHPKTVVFNEFLKYNDGLLVNEVKETEKISEEEALKKVEEYVSDINGKLNIGQQHIIEGFGILKKDNSGRITFKADESVKTGTAQAPEKPKEEKKEEPQAKKEDVPIELDEEKDKEEKAPEKPTAPAAKPAATQAKASASKEMKPKEETTPKKLPEKKQEPVVKETATPIETRKTTTETKKYVYTAPKSNRSRNIIWISMIVVIVGLITVWLIVNRDYIFGGDDETEQTTITLKPENDDAGPVDDQTGTQDQQGQTEEPQATPSESAKQAAESDAAETANQPSAGQKKYYIVAGCFQYEKNADNYVSYLRDQGFDADKFGKYGKLHAVSFDAFTSYNEAVNELNRIKKSTEPEAWILYY